MKNRIIIVLFILFPFIFESVVAYSNENKIPENVQKQTYQELYRLVLKDTSVTAIWVGEDLRILTESSDTPLEFGVKELIFQFSEDNKKIKFKPGGDLYHDCWSFDIFNGDGRYVVLLQSHYGPYHVIKIENLREYLTRKAPPFEIVKGEDTDSDGGVIHDTLQWISNDTFEFTAVCCGDERIVRHKIGFKTTRSLWKNQINFYSLIIFPIVMLTITGIVIVATIRFLKRKKRQHL